MFSNNFLVVVLRCLTLISFVLPQVNAAVTDICELPYLTDLVSTHVVVVVVNEYFVSNTVINIGGIDITINNAPVHISTTITSTQTVITTTTIIVPPTATTAATTSTVTGFVLAVSSVAALRRRQALPSFVNADGLLNTSCNNDNIYSFNTAGELVVGGEKIFVHANQTSANQTSGPFSAGTPALTDITTTFSSSNSSLLWSNPAFTGNLARFCLSNGTVEVIYRGVIPFGCSQIQLTPMPLSACPFISSSSSSSSSSATRSVVATNNLPITTASTSYSMSTNNPSVTTPGVASTTAQQSGATVTVDVTGLTYIDAMLQSHNVHRRNHSIVELTWSASLAATAQKIAATCVYQHDTTTDGGGYGQNIGAGSAGNAAAGLINNLMYNGEINAYPGPYGSDTIDTSNFEAWGHYSQLVWTSTELVGCYTQYCPNGLQNAAAGVAPYFTVCNYSPAGNYAGQWSMVAPPQGGATYIFVGQ